MAADAGADRPPLWRELLLGLAVFGLYALGNSIDWAGRHAAAAAHARSVFALERTLHLDIEPYLNTALSPHATLRVLANYEYATTYVISAFALIFWIYARRPKVYRWARTSFVLLNVTAVACFVAFPMLPPRLMPEQGFVDTVRLGHTWGSWGSPLVGHANQLAAMPSLHFAWALWVSVFLAYIAGGRRTQAVSAVHVLLTLVVILATANHYLLDAVAGAVLAWACVAVTKRLCPPEGTDPLVPAADVFFLHVENGRSPQHVGGVVLLDTSGQPGGVLHRDAVAAVIRAQLDELPRFRQRLSSPSRWRRPRWTEHGDLDWAWHVPERSLCSRDGSPGGLRGLDALVGEIAATPLPRDRPLWRVVVVPVVEPGTAAVVLVVHHVVADGIGAIGQALHLLEPDFSPPDTAAGRRPSAVQRALAIVLGLGQLATDGRPGERLGAGTGEREFATVTLPLDQVRALARRYGTRVTDVLLCLVAGALQEELASSGTPHGDRLRVAVPLMVREPGACAEGNVTAAVMVDVPLRAMAPAERLAEISRHTARLRTGTRPLASRFVMAAVGEMLPVTAHAWFARTVYGARFFSAIVSNMPGPDLQLSLTGAPIDAAFPLLPLAPGAPVAVGALGWNGALCIGIACDPAVVDDADALAVAVRSAFDALDAGCADVPVQARAGGSAHVARRGGAVH